MVKTLREFIDKAREWDGTQATNELDISGNWPILLYGDKDTLYSKIVSAFQNSPQEEGIRDSWLPSSPPMDTDRFTVFDYKPGTAIAIVNRYGWGSKPEFQINGESSSCHVMFHGYQKREMGGVTRRKAISLAIAGFCDYIIRAHLTAKLFPKAYDILDHVPERDD